MKQQRQTFVPHARPGQFLGERVIGTKLEQRVFRNEGNARAFGTFAVWIAVGRTGGWRRLS